MHHRVHQVFAHRDQRRGAAGREIEPAEQLLPARLGGVMQLGGGLVAPLARPGIDRRIDALAVDPEARRQRLEEGDARTGRQFVVAGENLARERDARGLAAPGQQLLAQLDQALRACRSVTAPVARAVDQRAAALRNGLQHFAEKRGVHPVLIASAAQPRSPDRPRLTFRDVEPDRCLRGHPSRLSRRPAFPLGRRTGYQV